MLVKCSNGTRGFMHLPFISKGTKCVFKTWTGLTGIAVEGSVRAV